METGKIVATSAPSISKFPVPAFNGIIIRPMEEEYVGRIHIPDQVKGKPSQGEIVAVGPGARHEDGTRITMEFSVGQIVVYKRYSGSEIKIKENLIDPETKGSRVVQNDYVIVTENDILAVLN